MSALSVGPRRGHPAGLPEEPLWRQDAGEPLQAPTPAQVVGQVLGRNPVAAVPPSGPSAVVSVDVLNRAGVVHHPHPGTAVNRLLGEVQLRGQGDVDGAAIGAPYPIGVQERLQDGAYRWGMGAGQDRSGGRRGTIAGDQHRERCIRQPACGRRAAPLARRARQVPAAGERCEAVGLGRCHEARQRRWLGLGPLGQQPVPPAVGGVLVNPTAPRRRANRLTGEQGPRPTPSGAPGAGTEPAGSG